MQTMRRAQLAVETMIVYGLVILVALSVIGGLLYFNILDIGAYLPDNCDLGGTSDLKCEEIAFSSSANELRLGVRNIGQRPISSLSVFVTDEEAVHFNGEVSATGEVSGAIISDTNALAPGDIASVVISTGAASEGKVLRGMLKTTYMAKDGAITQESSGTVRVRAS